MRGTPATSFLSASEVSVLLAVPCLAQKARQDTLLGHSHKPLWPLWM
jgi:hypothetical protein